MNQGMEYKKWLNKPLLLLQKSKKYFLPAKFFIINNVRVLKTLPDKYIFSSFFSNHGILTPLYIIHYYYYFKPFIGSLIHSFLGLPFIPLIEFLRKITFENIFYPISSHTRFLLLTECFYRYF